MPEHIPNNPGINPGSFGSVLVARGNPARHCVRLAMARSEA